MVFRLAKLSPGRVVLDLRRASCCRREAAGGSDRCKKSDDQGRADQRGVTRCEDLAGCGNDGCCIHGERGCLWFRAAHRIDIWLFFLGEYTVSVPTRCHQRSRHYFDGLDMLPPQHPNSAPDHLLSPCHRRLHYHLEVRMGIPSSCSGGGIFNHRVLRTGRRFDHCPRGGQRGRRDEEEFYGIRRLRRLLCPENIIGPQMVKSQTKSQHYPELWTGLTVCYCITIISASALYYTLHRENKKRDALGLDESERDRLAFKDLTDKENSYFRYVL